MATKTKEKKPKDIDKPLFYVKHDYRDFTKEGNPSLRAKRIEKISVGILKVWARRHIVGGTKADDWFDISLEGDQLVAWFKFEKDAKRFETMLEEVVANGIPLTKEWY